MCRIRFSFSAGFRDRAFDAPRLETFETKRANIAEHTYCFSDLLFDFIDIFISCPAPNEIDFFVKNHHIRIMIKHNGNTTTSYEQHSLGALQPRFRRGFFHVK